MSANKGVHGLARLFMLKSAKYQGKVDSAVKSAREAAQTSLQHSELALNKYSPYLNFRVFLKINARFFDKIGPLRGSVL